MADAVDGLESALAERYAIDCELGSGGMATVYLAEDLKHRRAVAIKVLKPELAAALGPTRFLQEIAIAAKLSHPHIVPLHDSGEAGGRLYYVMQYVDGESLRERLSRAERLQVPEVLKIARGVAEALDYTHRQGVIHRDLKPANILLHEGRPVLADFGIALLTARVSSERITATGVAVGTPEYMSPEQAWADREVDVRTDIYSLGCVIYEMLAGHPPPRVGATASFKERRGIPADLKRVLARCLQPNVDSRYQSARELLDDLTACEAGLTARRARLTVVLRRPAVLAGTIALIVVVVATGAGLGVRQSRARWARTAALPEAKRLIEQGRVYSAFRLLRRAESYLPDDPVLNDLLGESATHVSIRTTPSGAEVFVRDYFEGPDAWEFLGRSPIPDARLPVGPFAWRVSAEGFQTKEAVRPTVRRTIEFRLLRAAEAPPGMVHVVGGPYELFSTQAVQLEDYWIDKYEVTQRQFKAFVDSGGYERQDYWTEAFVSEGSRLSWEEAQRIFRDGTGRPGPATWELGAYAEGHEEHPVSGVSWYEAAAYCASVGKRLPTVYHWYRAADFHPITGLVPFSNFASAGPERVGHPLRMGSNGTFDMAGNVKEWTWNQASGDRRYLLGGGWNEPSYMMFWDHDAQRPTDRHATYGFRCAKYSAELPPALAASIERPSRDFRHERPVDDAMFAAFAGLYAYDRTPIDVRIESIDASQQHWRTERISYAAAYGKERVPALLFIPKNATPPYQTIIWFPAAGAFFTQSGVGRGEGQREFFQFFIRSGRAVFFPTYKGTYERTVGAIDRPHVWRDMLIHASKDLRSAIDYLETRADIDTGKLAYSGLSMGAGVGPIMTALEPRFKASVLLSGGLYPWRRPPESEALNFLPRVTVPTLMVNGRHDFFFPVDRSQQPMFRLLGTPAEHKRHVVFESGHIPTERQRVVKEALDWLDRYLGPPKRP